MPVVTNIYGTNAPDTVTYNIGDVATNATISGGKWQEITVAVNAERSRRGYGGITTPATSAGFTVEAVHLNALRDGINNAGYTGGFAGVSAGTIVAASHINSMIDKVQAAGAVCICNCNYCTCNCNYCTCNCNYACTCNCNYSDERLKMNIKFVGIQHGINMYSWAYKWSPKKSYVGVIAQELLGTKWEGALSQDSNGFYMVDYSKLPVKMKG